MERRKGRKMSASSPRRINRDKGEGRNECNNNASEINNVNNMKNMLNDNKNDSGDDENETQVSKVSIERRNDRELKHKGKLDGIKKGGSIRTCSTNVRGF